MRAGWGINVFHVDDEKGLMAYGMANSSAAVIRLDNNEARFALEENNTPVLALDHDAQNNLLAFENAKGRVLLVDVATGDAVIDV